MLGGGGGAGLRRLAKRGGGGWEWKEFQKLTKIILFFLHFFGLEVGGHTCWGQKRL